jgi:nitric-oxide synthase
MSLIKGDIFSRAEAFLKTCYQELKMEDKLQERLDDVKKQILQGGTYHHTTEELTHGARMAWRNSNRCIGRLYWKTLKVIDARHLEDEDEIFSALEHHIDYAYNNGEIRSTITVFRQQMPDEPMGPRILNHQLLHFAGHLQQDGTVVGDPSEIEFTQWCQSMGYKFDHTAFDMLPHAIQWPGKEQKMKIFTLPEGIVFPILHPEYEWFSDLKLFWYAVPIISEMMMEIGGITYTAAPFNGWYMVTEIGSRNFGDTERYNMLPAVAQQMGLDIHDDFSFWKDRAMIELNRAVLYSYHQRGISMSSHYESSEQFIQFEASEQRRGRNITADWSWITPPISGSALEVFHRNYDNTVLTPNFFYQDPVIGKPKQNIPKGCPFHSQSLEG